MSPSIVFDVIGKTVTALVGLAVLLGVLLSAGLVLLGIVMGTITLFAGGASILYWWQSGPGYRPICSEVAVISEEPARSIAAATCVGLLAGADWVGSLYRFVVTGALMVWHPAIGLAALTMLTFLTAGLLYLAVKVLAEITVRVCARWVD